MQRLESEMRQTKKNNKRALAYMFGYRKACNSQNCSSSSSFFLFFLVVLLGFTQVFPGSGVADFLSFSDSAILWQCLCVCVWSWKWCINCIRFFFFFLIRSKLYSLLSICLKKKPILLH